MYVPDTPESCPGEGGVLRGYSLVWMEWEDEIARASAWGVAEQSKVPWQEDV